MEVIELLGVLLILVCIYRLIVVVYIIVWPYLIGPYFGFSVKPETLGKWAVITGATDGIGKGYAAALAVRGMNVCLMSRTEAKLKAVADEIKRESPSVEVQTFQMDFGTDKLEDYDRVEKKLKSLDIGVLVNNVGMITEVPEKYLETPREVTKSMLLVNNLSFLMMTNIVLPGMLERHRGAIINISSTSALAPERLMNVYAASKVSIEYFTHALAKEYSGRGVTFQIIQPGFVATKMVLMESSYLAPDPRLFAESCLKTLGVLPCGNGYLGHHLEVLSGSWLPQCIQYKLACGLVDGLRERLLKAKQTGDEKKNG